LNEIKSSEDSAPQQLQYISTKKNNDEFFVIENKMKRRRAYTHIHFITRLEMKLLVVIADSDLVSRNSKKNESNPIFWLNNYLMMIFGLANNGFYETFFTSSFSHSFYMFLFLMPVLHFK
jgi:hypothetical protein